MYACRVEYDSVPGVMRDCFLIWAVRDWYWEEGNIKFAGTVHGYLGPLERKLGG